MICVEFRSSHRGLLPSIRHSRDPRRPPNLSNSTFRVYTSTLLPLRKPYKRPYSDELNKNQRGSKQCCIKSSLSDPYEAVYLYAWVYDNTRKLVNLSCFNRILYNYTLSFRNLVVETNLQQ